MDHHPLTFDEHVTTIEVQIRTVANTLRTADLGAPVPSCPGWNIAQVLRHLGGGQRWLTEIVTTRATTAPDDTAFRDLAPYAGDRPAEVVPWLLESSAGLVAALREAGPDARVWTPLADDRVSWFARRFAHETLVHGADALLAVGVEPEAPGAVWVDALTEWIELGSLPQMFDFHPHRRELLGPGRVIALRATDVDDLGWIVDLSGEALAWRPVSAASTPHDTAAIVTGPVRDLVLVLYRRRSAAGGGVAVAGDAALVDRWLDLNAFG